MCSKIGGGFSNINLNSIAERVPALAEDYDHQSVRQYESVERTFNECLSIEIDMSSTIDLYEVIVHETERDDPEPAFFYHSDHLGSAAYLTNDAGQVTQTLNYLPYGEDWVDIQNYAETRYPRLGIYTYNGKEKDYESGFHYYGARYYWSEVLTGWLSVDPMSDKYPNISPYAYCAWNPVIFVDPDGKAVIPTNALKANASVSNFFRAVGNNSIFRKTMHRYYSNQSNVYIHLSRLMKNGAPSGRQNVARTESANCQTNPVGKYGIERIILNSDILDKQGNITGDKTFIFSALLHEGLHAKMYDTRQFDPTYSNYPGYKDFILSRPKEGEHHNQMGAFNRQLLIDGMKEFDGQMGTSHSEEWYEAISWAGLQDTTAWREFETNNPEKAARYIRIQNVEVKKLGDE